MASILNSTKKILGLAESYTAFDVDVMTHINSTFDILNQLGVGPEEGFFIEDATPEWEDFVVLDSQRNLVRTYVYLKVRAVFDPPATSFHIGAMERQIAEYEGRLSLLVPPTFPPEPVLEEEEVII